MFAHAGSRISKQVPKLEPVVRIVNNVIAQKLEREPLVLPTTTQAMQAWVNERECGIDQRGRKSPIQPEVPHRRRRIQPEVPHSLTPPLV